MGGGTRTRVGKVGPRDEETDALSPALRKPQACFLERRRRRPAGVIVKPQSVLSSGKRRPVLKHQCALAVGTTPGV